MTTASPLSWPNGWPRAKNRTSNRLLRASFETARRQLSDELRRLGAKNIVISTNLPLRQDGMPYAGSAMKRMQDPGVAVFFVLKGKQLSMARDAYHDIAQNMQSLALAIDGLRKLERHGGSYMMERAFDGFAALPPPGPTKRTWRVVMGFPPGVPSRGERDRVEQRFRALAKERHPDSGTGSHEAMTELNAALDEALREIAA